MKSIEELRQELEAKKLEVQAEKDEQTLHRISSSHQPRSEYRKALEQFAQVWAKAIGWTFTTSKHIQDIELSGEDYYDYSKREYKMLITKETLQGNTIREEQTFKDDIRMTRKALLKRSQGVSIRELEQLFEYVNVLQKTSKDITPFLEQYYHICPHCHKPIYATYEQCGHCQSINQQYDSDIALLLGSQPTTQYAYLCYNDAMTMSEAEAQQYQL